LRKIAWLSPLWLACHPEEAPLSPPQAAPVEAMQRISPAWLFTSEFTGGCYHSTLRPGGQPLQNIVNQVGPARVLVVDQDCTVDGQLLLPERFTLTGAGWAGAGSLILTAGAGIFLDGGADDEAHTTIENLQIQGPGSGTALTLDHRHQVHLRDLIVRGFEYGVDANVSFSVMVDDCSFHNNVTSFRLGAETNSWRFRGGICSQSTTCMDLHPGGDGNDTLVEGVRMESNTVAVRVGGLSTWLAFNRFEGNGTDVEVLPTATGTAQLANNTSTGTYSDLSELAEDEVTGLPLLDGQISLGIGPNAPTAQLFTGYIGGANLLRTVLTSNQTTDDGSVSVPSYAQGYAGWQLEMDSSIQGSTSAARFAYRAPGSNAAPAEVFRVGSDGTATATAFTTFSDERLKRDIEPLDSALDKLERLRGVSYTWREGAAQGERSMGLLAQEVEQSFPDAVVTDERGRKAVNYDQLTAPIVEAIKELGRENEALRREVQALQRTRGEGRP
jgi:hypothetical protein